MLGNAYEARVQASQDSRRCTERLGMEPEEHFRLLEEAWAFGLASGMIRRLEEK